MSSESDIVTALIVIIGLLVMLVAILSIFSVVVTSILDDIKDRLPQGGNGTDDNKLDKIREILAE